MVCRTFELLTCWLVSDSCSWSRNNRYLLSASLDGTAIIWDLAVASPLLRPHNPAGSATVSRSRTIRFDAPLATAQFHPRNSNIILATLTCNEVVLADLRGEGRRDVLEDVMEGEQDGEGQNDEGANGEEAAAPRKKCV